MSHSYTIGIGLNLFDARAVLLRDDGKIVTRIEKQRDITNANETIEVLLELFEAILSKSKRYKETIKGVGLALGGIVSSNKGIVYWPQKQDACCVYIALPLKDFLEKKFGFPVHIENDANACLWAEHLTNFSNKKHLLYFFSGIGCGIMTNGALYKGRDGEAGELFLNPYASMKSSLGDFSFLKQWSVDLGMIKRAAELISLGRRTILIKKISPTGQLTLDSVLKAANSKDTLAIEIVQEAAFALGVKIAFLVNLLNPEIVIIGGGLQQAGSIFLEACKKAVKQFSFSEMKKELQIVFSELGSEATALGAGLLAHH